jgi:hypothetical protein
VKQSALQHFAARCEDGGEGSAILCTYCVAQLRKEHNLPGCDLTQVQFRLDMTVDIECDGEESNAELDVCEKCGFPDPQQCDRVDHEGREIDDNGRYVDNGEVA